MGKLTKDEIDFYTSEFCEGNELGDLKEIETESIKPWEKSKENFKLNKTNFPDTENIANELME